jgi:hypothetical protein
MFQSTAVIQYTGSAQSIFPKRTFATGLTDWNLICDASNQFIKITNYEGWYCVILPSFFCFLSPLPFSSLWHLQRGKKNP